MLICDECLNLTFLNDNRPNRAGLMRPYCYLYKHYLNYKSNHIETCRDCKKGEEPKNE